MDYDNLSHIIHSFPCEGVLAILIHGSQVDATHHAFSDVDICIVAPDINARSKRALLHSLSSHAGIDAHFFEDLPLMIKKDIICKNRSLFVCDEGELHSYFLFWQKVYESFVPTYVCAKQHASERFALWKSKKRLRKNTTF